jgi:hypothetical protein
LKACSKKFITFEWVVADSGPSFGAEDEADVMEGFFRNFRAWRRKESSFQLRCMGFIWYVRLIFVTSSICLIVILSSLFLWSKHLLPQHWALYMDFRGTRLWWLFRLNRL